MSLFWVVGAGGVGASMAARLAQHHVVVIIDGWFENVEAMRSRGLVLRSPAGQLTAKVDTFHFSELETATLPAPEAILLAVKSMQTRETVEALASKVRGDVPVVSLQNGLNEETIAEVIGARRTIGAVVRFEGSLREAGTVEQFKDGGTLSIGELDCWSSPRVEQLACVLGSAVPTTATDDIWTDLWSKLIRNCLLNPVAAASGLDLATMSSGRAAARVCAGIAAESVAVARANGINISSDVVYNAAPDDLADGRSGAIDAFLDGFRSTYAAQHGVKPSMLQDIEKRRPTEIDHLNGVIQRKGVTAGIPTPYNDRIIGLVRTVQSGAAVSSPELLMAATR